MQEGVVSILMADRGVERYATYRPQKCCCSERDVAAISAAVSEVREITISPPRQVVFL